MDDTGLMRPGPTVAAAEDEERRRRESGLLGLMAAITEPLMYAPNMAISGPAMVANRIGTDGWQTGLAAGAADLAMNLAVRNGPQVLKAMGPASKVDPQRLDALRKTLKAGTPPEDAYTYFRMLPMLDTSGKLVDDAWAPAIKSMPKLGAKLLSARDEVRYMRDVEGNHGKITIPFEKAYAEGEADKLLKVYPEIAKLPVSVTSTLKASEGELVRGKNIRLGADTPLSGRNNLAAILGHEGTHAVQHIENLPFGGSPSAVGTDKRRALNQAMDSYLYSGDMYSASIDRRAQKIEALKLRIAQTGPGPGIESERIISEIRDPALQKLAVLLAWDERQKSLRAPDYTHYRGLHGEQIAEGGAQNANALPLKFTTPLAKQPISSGEIESGEYQLRMQKLFDAIMRGEAVDPRARPFSFSSLP
jgi:hypothetical protein